MMADGPASSGSGAAEHALRACLRDLTSLNALPAMWGDKPPEEILRSLCQVLETILPLDLVFACSSTETDEANVRILRMHEEWKNPRDASFEQLVEHIRNSANESIGTITDPEFGRLRLLRVDLGHGGRHGYICVGSSLAAFPSDNDVVILRSAVTLAAGALHNARLIIERERAGRVKDEFLAMLGHELRNPLSPIVTALHLMKNKAGAQVTREQEIIERQVGHLTRLVDDLLDISRVTNGRIALGIEHVALCDVVAKAVETVAPLIDVRRHQLDVQVPSDITLDADPTRIAQVLQNLLINAAKYTDPGGNISLHAGVDGQDVCISVRDTGVGMDPVLLPKVFDVFTQAATQLDRSRGGLGIGLALVKSLVSMHGGRVMAASRGYGHGSEFRVWLPMHRADQTIDVPVAPCERVTTSALDFGSILVVDDNRDAAVSLADVLRDGGYAVEVAHNATEALRLLAHKLPRAAILDIGLPGMNGYELAAHMRMAFGDKCPNIIALTGYNQEGDRVRALNSGFDRHFAKPVDVDALFRFLQELP
jgi:signal transduction histidine kinase